MKNLFIPYELAVIAKEKGFNEPCFGYFICDTLIVIGEDIDMLIKDAMHQNLMAPLYQQIVDWFRENHKIKICENERGGWNIFYNWNGQSHSKQWVESLDKAIAEAFKLI